MKKWKNTVKLFTCELGFKKTNGVQYQVTGELQLYGLIDRRHWLLRGPQSQRKSSSADAPVCKDREHKLCNLSSYCAAPQPLCSASCAAWLVSPPRCEFQASVALRPFPCWSRSKLCLASACKGSSIWWLIPCHCFIVIFWYHSRSFVLLAIGFGVPILTAKDTRA